MNVREEIIEHHLISRYPGFFIMLGKQPVIIFDNFLKYCVCF